MTTIAEAKRIAQDVARGHGPRYRIIDLEDAAHTLIVSRSYLTDATVRLAASTLASYRAGLRGRAD